MDVRSKAVALTGFLHLHDADDEPMVDEKGEKVGVFLYSPGSKQFAKAQTTQSNKLVDKLKRKGKTDQTPEQKAKETAEFLTACTHSFTGNFEYSFAEGDPRHGQPAVKGGDTDRNKLEPMAMAVYMDQEIGFIAEQIDKHIRDWGNFSKASTNSSASSSGNQPG